MGGRCEIDQLEDDTDKRGKARTSIVTVGYDQKQGGLINQHVSHSEWRIWTAQVERSAPAFLHYNWENPLSAVRTLNLASLSQDRFKNTLSFFK